MTVTMIRSEIRIVIMVPAMVVVAFFLEAGGPLVAPIATVQGVNSR